MRLLAMLIDEAFHVYKVKTTKRINGFVLTIGVSNSPATNRKYAASTSES
jgi:hypothetical protein